MACSKERTVRMNGKRWWQCLPVTSICLSFGEVEEQRRGQVEREKGSPSQACRHGPGMHEGKASLKRVSLSVGRQVSSSPWYKAGVVGGG